MTTSTSETVPTAWTTADERFFLVVRDLFPTDFLAGATVLLASYDDDAAAVSPAKTCGQPHPAEGEHLGTMVAEVSGQS